MLCPGKDLLSAGASIDMTDREGWTALMWAVKSGSYEVVQVRSVV